MRGRAVGYVRVGKRDEDAFQHLAGRQIDLIAGWAADNGADVLDWCFDIGVNATEPLLLRSGGRQLLDLIRRGGLDFVIVASLRTLGQGQALFDALQLVMGATQETGVVAVLRGRQDAAGSDGASAHPWDRADGSRDLKAA